jgi:hypothetical protein
MRAAMHPNYRKSFVRFGAVAFSQRPVLSNRAGVPACALADSRESDVLVR